MKKSKQTILVTGGAGYIGSHTVVTLQQAGYKVVIVDNFSNSTKKAIDAIAKITGTRPTFYELDVCDEAKLAEIFQKEKPDSVINFAGLKAVGESVENPLLYYQNNLKSTLSLLRVMANSSVYDLVFSSSATVYAPLETARKIVETDPLAPSNPYGQTKFMIEQILQDLAASNKAWNITSLRYFNPIGAHPSGLIGEQPSGTPNNLMPYVSRVASGSLEQLSIFGNDYDTMDGTGVRDYLHVIDLANGHLAALKNLSSGHQTINLGTGQGTSVLELVRAFEQASSKKIPHQIAERRPGDLPYVVADPTKAKAQLNWEANLSIADACRDEWNWIRNSRAN